MTASTTETLEPCPWCGEVPPQTFENLRHGEDDEIVNCWTVIHECRLLFSPVVAEGATEADAIAAWNRRTSPDHAASHAAGVRERDKLWCEALLTTLTTDQAQAVLVWFNKHRGDTPSGDADPWCYDMTKAPWGKFHPYAQPNYPETVQTATFVLIWNGYHVGVAYCIEEEDGSGARAWTSEYGEPVLPPPTAWQPLPTPPAPKGGDNG